VIPKAELKRMRAALESVRTPLVVAQTKALTDKLLARVRPIVATGKPGDMVAMILRLAGRGLRPVAAFAVVVCAAIDAGASDAYLEAVEAGIAHLGVTAEQVTAFLNPPTAGNAGTGVSP
jgi:hypothetical protein